MTDCWQRRSIAEEVAAEYPTTQNAVWRDFPSFADLQTMYIASNLT